MTRREVWEDDDKPGGSTELAGSSEAETAYAPAEQDSSLDPNGTDGSQRTQGPSPESIPEADIEAAARERSEAAFAKEKSAHVKDFVARTGMTPHRCYQLVLFLILLRTVGETMRGLVMLEYTRYYVVNSMFYISLIETATGSPQSLFKAFTFPMWGLVADRCSRRKVLALASIVNLTSAWLLLLYPAIGVLIAMRAMTLIGNLTWTIREAMLRDLFSRSEWERKDGGITGIKSRMALFGTICSGVGAGLGMGVLFLGDHGYSRFRNEYQEHKDDCGSMYCLEPGQQSWDHDGWQIEGSLRLVMLMGTCFLTLETLVLCFCLPETLPPEFKTEASICRFIWRRRREFLRPWNNLRVFATKQLRELLQIRVIYFVIGSGFSAIFWTWYRRMDLDSLQMYSMGVCAGVAGFILTAFIPKIVKKWGDLRGVWVPAGILGLMYALCVALVPGSLWWLSYVYMFVLMGPGVAFAGLSPELLSKLMPPDVQGTFQTAKVFIYDIQKAVTAWPWLGLYLVSDKLPYPLDALAVWVALGLGIFALCLIKRQLAKDPKDALLNGTALDPYFATDYVRGKWYRRHGGRTMAVETVGAGGRALSIRGQVAAAEGKSKAGIMLTDADDVSFAEQLGWLTQQVVNKRSLSVLIAFEDDLMETPMHRSPERTADSPAFFPRSPANDASLRQAAQVRQAPEDSSSSDSLRLQLPVRECFVPAPGGACKDTIEAVSLQRQTSGSYVPSPGGTAQDASASSSRPGHLTL